MSGVDLHVNFCGVEFNNPFILAASPPSDSREMTPRAFEAGWAGAVLKTVSPVGNHTPLVYPMMSSLGPGPNMLGLHNIDLISDKLVDEWSEDIRWLKQRFPEHRVILSIVGGTQAEWQKLIQQTEEAGADMVEASISCPQGAMLEGEKADGWMISQDVRLTEKVTRWMAEASKKTPFYIKITSAVTDIRAIARAVERGGASGVCVIDSVEGIIGIDFDTLAPMPVVQGYGTRGGYTGRGIKPIALRCVADVAEAVAMPISGVGGIYDWRDAVQFLLLGATTLQVCTGVMQKGFQMVDELSDGLARWLEERNYSRPAEIVGLSLKKLLDIDKLEMVKVISHIDPELCVRCGLCYIACNDGAHTAIRFEQPGRKVSVDEERCVGCGFCAQVCPVPDCICILPARRLTDE